MNLERLNPKQREAVLCTEGPLLIFAGAGSGKTRVLVHRIAHLIKNLHVNPWRIFAVTFTNKAAGEMRERIQEILGMRADEIWMSTFHSAGVRILRRYPTRLGYGPNFVIYDDTDQLSLIKQCLEELQLNPKNFNPRAVQTRIDAAKNELIGPEEFSADDFFGERVAKIYSLYAEKLKQNNAVDFGDLLVLPVKLFEKYPEILAEYQNNLQYLMVDEYQDTNHAQYRLIQLLAGQKKNLCVVGDDDQSIYRWRGADIQNILDFEKDFPQTQVIKLEQNYRSSKNILAAATEVVREIEKRCEKTLWTENESGEPIVYYTGHSDKAEAAFVVQTIQSLVASEGYQLSQFAIFYRTNAQSRIFEDELRRQNMPYLIYGGVRFYDRMEIKDCLSYLWVLVNPADELHLKRIINTPARGIGKVTMDRLEDFARRTQLPLFEAMFRAGEAGLSDGVAKKVLQFAELMKTLQEYAKAETPSQLVRTLLDRSGYLQELKNEGTLEAEGRLENLEELVSVLAEYEEGKENPSLAEFLDQVSLVSDLDKWDDRKHALPLMTLHLAKGLEFDIVFFVGMEEGLLPHLRSFDTQEEMDEERRLTYVGMTRARKRLYLCNALRRKVFGNDQFNLPSRFLDTISPHLIQRIESKETYRWDSADDFDAEPFAFLSAKPKIKAEEPNNPYRIGIKVKHPVFGIGTIRHCEGDSENRKLTIAFAEVGPKKLVAKFSNLIILG